MTQPTQGTTPTPPHNGSQLQQHFERLRNKRSVADLKPVSVRNLIELKELLKGYQSENTMTSKLLVQGFKMLAGHQKVSETHLDEEADYGGFIPPNLPSGLGHKTWVDRLVETQLGGRRDGLVVLWSLPEGQFVYDPLSKVLQQR
jgi:hypothetical protein